MERFDLSSNNLQGTIPCTWVGLGSDAFGIRFATNYLTEGPPYFVWPVELNLANNQQLLGAPPSRFFGAKLAASAGAAGTGINTTYDPVTSSCQGGHKAVPAVRVTIGIVLSQ